MSGLLYRPDWEEARDRLTTWWNGGDIGRPAMQITAPRPEPAELIEALPQPEGWVTHYSTRSLDYRVNLALRSCIHNYYLAEAVPYTNPGDVGPNSLALFLGCTGREMPDTVWFKRCMETPEDARFEYDPGNFYWRFCLDAHRKTLQSSRGKFLHQFPDLIEGLDTLAAMRGTERLLVDLVERPDWVHACLREITDRYFHYYDVLYDLIRDEVGGSVFWAWAPGRMVKLQCDISANISPGMFRDFMLPVLVEMTERVGYSMYHWDGPGAVRHLDALLEVPRLSMVQWTPGAGEPGTWHETWWPLYHRILDAGKKLYIWAGKEHLESLKREFGEKSKGIMITMHVPSREDAEECMRIMET